MKRFRIGGRHTLMFLIPLVLAGLGVRFYEAAEEASDVDVLQVPDGFSIELVAGPDLLSYPMFASFDDAGRLFVFESSGPNTMSTEDMLDEPPYHIRLVEDVNGDGVFDRSNIFADDIPFPMGGVFLQGSLYVAAPPNLMRFADTDGDGAADEREVILTGWVLNHNGAILSGPFLGPDGWLYLADARRGFEIESKEGKVLKGNSARIWRARPDGSGLESMSGGGFDNAVELIFMPSGETIGTMTYFVDPQHGQRDALMHWVEGGTYPKPHSVIEEDDLKLTGELMPVMTKMPRVAPSGLMRYRGTAFGEEFDGNLFSVQFNTGRVLRHTITPDGATFRTEDTPFLTSRSSDTHPTDVLQDADGSLLVLDTGGWFIEGCPLSRVAKPNVEGGIYRIRKVGAPVVDDPWGRELDLDAMASSRLAALLEDERPFVRDRAVEGLVERGRAAVPSLWGVLRDAASEEVRASAVFALSRIGTGDARLRVRSALDDRSVTVRTAAARVLGLARDGAALDRLMTMVQDDEAPARRQAATALGQMGDKRAVDALIRASADPDDRFVEHAITYSLITLADAQPLLAALDHPSPNVRKAALIALDQMDDSPLTRERLVPFLTSDDAQLRSTGIWVASHHSDWADVVLEFLGTRLNAVGAEAEATSVRDLMTTFCDDSQVQALIARRLESADTPAASKLLLMDVIDDCAVKELPAAWVRPLGRQLQHEDARVRSRTLALIESRSITTLEGQLERIVQDPAARIDFRLEALGALIVSRPQLSQTEFELLLEHLEPAHESPIRQQAAMLLARAELTDSQLLTLARGPVAEADLFLLPRLVDAFEGSSDAEVGEALVAALHASTDRLDNLSEQNLRAILAHYPASVRQSAGPLMAALQQRHAERLSRLEELESSLKGGDVGEGRALFFGKAVCSVCHAVGTEGGDFGPDLTNIGEIRSRHDILEAILYPNASFAREYDTYRVETATNTYTGIIAEQLQEAVIVETAPGARVRVPRSEITSIQPHTTSLMPPGLDRQLSTDEMADLMAFLEALPYDIERLIETRERGFGSLTADLPSVDGAIVPDEPIHLFNGKDLSNFYTWLADYEYEDPHRVFTVVDQIDGAPAIRISGEDWGGIITEAEYADYHLIVEYRWGEVSWGERKNAARDSGVLLHAQGREGNREPDFTSPWMRSIEFQIIEGGTGDVILIDGYTEDGKRIMPSLTTTVRKDRDGETVWDPNGEVRTLESGRINWYGRDPDWDDQLNFRGRHDVEKPAGEWNRIEAFVKGDELTYLVNGEVVMKGRDAKPSRGKLLFQSESAEIYFRRIELRPLQ